MAKLPSVLYIGPGHDSWVVGDEPYVSLHFMGGENYAEGKKWGEQRNTETRLAFNSYRRGKKENDFRRDGGHEGA